MTSLDKHKMKDELIKWKQELETKSLNAGLRTRCSIIDCLEAADECLRALDVKAASKRAPMSSVVQCLERVEILLKTDLGEECIPGLIERFDKLEASVKKLRGNVCNIDDFR